MNPTPTLGQEGLGCSESIPDQGCTTGQKLQAKFGQRML